MYKTVCSCIAFHKKGLETIGFQLYARLLTYIIMNNQRSNMHLFTSRKQQVHVFPRGNIMFGIFNRADPLTSSKQAQLMYASPFIPIYYCVFF